VLVVVTRRAVAGVGCVEPVVVVVEGAVTVVAAVLGHQRRVVELDTGVDVRHHDALALDAVLRPDVIGVDVRDAPLEGVDGLLGRALGDLRNLILHGGVEAGDLGAGREGLHRRRRSAEHLDGVGGPERLVLGLRAVELRDDAGLAGRGGLLERGRDRGAALVPVLDGACLAQVRLGPEVDPEIRLRLGLQRCGERGLDLVGFDRCLGRCGLRRRAGRHEANGDDGSRAGAHQ
jgi:hypothetical protein